MASTAALSAATQDRKSRLAQLKSLKRKQAPTEDYDEATLAEAHAPAEDSPAPAEDTSRYLSGRNYDPETKGPRLGFENAPDEGASTLEAQATALATQTKAQAEQEIEEQDKPLDLFKLRPKKPNWDLKRDLEQKMEVLGVRTDNAIARIVRERIANQQSAAKGEAGGDGEGVGMEGNALVEATHVREREDEEDARREREEDAALLDGS